MGSFELIAEACDYHSCELVRDLISFTLPGIINRKDIPSSGAQAARSVLVATDYGGPALTNQIASFIAAVEGSDGLNRTNRTN